MSTRGSTGSGTVQGPRDIPVGGPSKEFATTIGSSLIKPAVAPQTSLLPNGPSVQPTPLTPGNAGTQFTSWSSGVQYACKLIENGYSPIPIVPSKKYPAIKKWERLCKEQLFLEEVKREWRDIRRGFGAACGYLGLVAIDIDTDNNEIQQIIRDFFDVKKILGKIGQKGFTIFVRDLGFKRKILTRLRDDLGQIEFLTTGQQCVLPPSIHPDSGKPYIWINDERTLFNTHIDDLQVVDVGQLIDEKFLVTLKPWLAEEPDPAPVVDTFIRKTSPDRKMSDLEERRQKGRARKALANKCAELSATKETGGRKGGRDNLLRTTSCAVGVYYWHGYLGESEVIDALVAACEANGLLKEKGRNGIHQTIRYGLKKSEHDPLPPLDDRPFVNDDTRRSESDNVQEKVERQPIAQVRQQPSDDIDVKSWPVLKEAASYGLVGEIVKLACANSEADPASVASTVLAMAGAMFGRKRFISVGDTIHHSRHYYVLVGSSSRSRKGTSLNPVRRIFTEAQRYLLSGRPPISFPSGSELKISHGPLSSGEGLIAAIRDPRDEEDDGGVQDKRLLCIESEFGAVLKVCQRPGNTLSSTLRTAWDGMTIAPLTKHDKISATDPHICIVAHITNHELREMLAPSDLWNGFANRFMWVAVRRRGSIPLPQPMNDAKVKNIADELSRFVSYAHSNPGPMEMSKAALDHWCNAYPKLTADHPGILGAVTSRGEAHVRRLALTYAQLDGADIIELPAMEQAIEFWRYSFDSAGYIFSGAELDPVAGKIVDALAKRQMSQTEISGLFDRHLKRERLSGVLTDLQERGRITLETVKTGGSPKKVWSLAG